MKTLRWSVVWADLSPSVGHEQAGFRPVLIVSNEAFHRSGMLTVVPMTSAASVPRYDGEVAIPQGEAGLRRSGLILCSQVRTISVDRVKHGDAGFVRSSRIRAMVRSALATQLGLAFSPTTDGAEGTFWYRGQR